MLEKVRKPGRAKSIFAYIIFGLICLVFVFFGITPDFGGQAGGAAAVVNNSVISIGDFRERVQRVESMYRENIDELPEAERQIFSQRIRQQALEDLIAFELAYQAGIKEGIQVSDQEVREYILNIPAFQEDGRFRRDLYNQYLSFTRQSAADFEKRIRKEVVVSRIQSLFAQAIQPVVGQDLNDRLLRETKLSLEFVEFSKDLLKTTIEPTPQAIREFLAHPESTQRVEEYYANNKSRFEVPNQVKARHILVQTFNPEAQRSDSEARQRAEEARTRLLAGEDWSLVASRYSDDPASQSKGGDLGWFGRGQMVPEFEQVVFNLEPGELSEPFATDFGYHVVLLEEKQEAHTRSLDQVQGEIASVLWAESQVDKALASLQEAVYGGSRVAVDRQLKNWGLEWSSTGEFDLSRDIMPKLGENNRLLSAVLRQGKEGLVPELITSGGRYYIVNVTQLTVPRLENGTEEESSFPDMAQMLAFQRANETFGEWIETQKEAAKIRRNNRLF